MTEQDLLNKLQYESYCYQRDIGISRNDLTVLFAHVGDEASLRKIPAWEEAYQEAKNVPQH